MFKLNKMKGFTLIELLAVIVILAIIALIATPLILNVISDAKKGAFQASSYGIIEASEQAYARSLLKGDNTSATVYEYKEGKEEILQGDIKINYKGNKPNNGILLINNEGKVAIAFYQDGYCALKSYSESSIRMEDMVEDDCMVPEDMPEVVIQEPNKPQIATGMTPIKWTVTTEGGFNEATTTIDDPEWYDYNNKKWANAKTADGSYWVWIPRYAYKIKSGYHSSTAGEFDIVFLEGKTNKNSQGVTIETSGYEVGVKDTSMHHFLHPAFNQGGEEILGYWVAKFEPSGTTSAIKIVPNVASLRSVTVNDIFTSVKNMKNGSSYGWSSSKVDPHLMTNLEWGAVAYLTHSVYGKNAEVWINPNNSFTTGCAGASVSAAGGTACSVYTTANGQQASTTGNITGIYDMSGGAWEYVASYVNNNNSNLTSYALSLLNETNLKYKNVYVVGSTDDRPNNYGANKNIYGDAVYEISSTGSGSISWNGDYSNMPYGQYPVFVRGGRYSSTSDAGLFHFGLDPGNSYTYYSFRVSFRVLE